VNDNSVRADWEAELDRLEQHVTRAERLLRGLAAPPVEPWAPPAIAGQMPADLVERAQDLLDRQDRVTEHLAGCVASAQRQIAFGDRVGVATGRPPAGPVYLDLDA
jgi:hypothetical protein